MIPVVESLQGDGGDDAYWWALALGAMLRRERHHHRRGSQRRSCGEAARAGRPIGFTFFLRIGLPATFVSMIIAAAYIALRYV